MFMSDIAHQYIHMAVVFLTARVKKPEKDNWGGNKASVEISQGNK